MRASLSTEPVEPNTLSPASGTARTLSVHLLFGMLVSLEVVVNGKVVLGSGNDGRRRDIDSGSCSIVNWK